MRRILSISLLATALLLAGCAADEQDSSAPSAGDDRAVGHIHGLGVDPADDTLFVATHHGLFHVDESGEPRRVADRWQDTMAFTVVGSGHFLASGHPDLREDLPPHLGLIESTDAGETWQPLALQGEADFHILEQVGEDLYAYDATSGRLLVTQDRESFDEVARLPLISITADPDDSNTLLGTTNQGQLIEIDAATGAAKELPGPPVVFLDTTPEGDLVGIAPEGTIQVSNDAGKTWKTRGEIGGQPAAFIITDGEWYAATQDQVFRSDDGDTWTRIL
jgi:outer membrane protein assembly factor BamB